MLSNYHQIQNACYVQRNKYLYMHKILTGSKSLYISKSKIKNNKNTLKLILFILQPQRVPL